jgi:hypothetical protein
MRNIRVVLLVLLLFSAIGYSQDTSDVHQQTVAPINARFEIVQSELSAKWTFRLDRFTGRVAQLVQTRDGGMAWQDTPVIGIPQISSPLRARFQVFTSGLAAIHTYLIDTETGRTWQLASEKGKNPDGSEFENVVWQPFGPDD